MDNLATRKYAGIDFGLKSVQFSVYDEAKTEIAEESFPLPSGGGRDYVEEGFSLIEKYMEVNEFSWEDYSDVNFSMEVCTEENRRMLASLLPASFKERFRVNVITHFRAFVEYVFHQEKVMWDRNTLLLEYVGDKLNYILIDQIRRSKQKAYRASLKSLDLKEQEIEAGSPELDLKFSKLMKRFLVKNPANIIFLTGEGFDGNWMKKTLNYLCAGRRVFLGQNLYANGACLLGISTIPLMDDGMILMDGPDMVCHTIGVITSDAGKAKYTTVTSIGQEWYNTKGSVDVILDKSQRVEFFFHNTRENEIEGASCEIKDIPKRPPKTTRIRVSVNFTSAFEGVILLEDLGFGEMYPGTGKITVFPFQLIS